MHCGQRIHNLIPDTGSPPTNEAIVTGRIGAKGVRQIAPWRARSQDPEYALEHPPVIHTRYATGLVRKERPDGGLLIVAEFVADDSRLLFGGSRATQHHQPATPVMTDTNSLILVPLSGVQPTWPDKLLAASRSKMTHNGLRHP